jgi:hypothetical protein
VVCDFFAEGLCEVSKIAGETQAHFPRLIFSSAEQLLHGVHAILLLCHVLSHRDQ